MNPKHFHDKIDQQRLVAALADAERATVGKIYVYVSHRHVTDALASAQRRFERLGLARIHDHRASILIYIAPRTYKFAIIGDTAIHNRCGDEYWTRLAEQLSLDLKAGDITAALLKLISTLKKTLEQHFPR